MTTTKKLSYFITKPAYWVDSYDCQDIIEIFKAM